MTHKPKALVFTGYGINCEHEHQRALIMAGADADIAHLRDIFDNKVSIHDYDMLHFPGGFSYGDDIAAGKALAGMIKLKKCPCGRTLFQELLEFIDEGKHILGICNGFQVLVALGLLPGLDPSYRQEVALVHNKKGNFINKWCHCYIPKNQPSTLLPKNILLDLPIRHGEGRLYVPVASTQKAILDLGLICLYYSDASGIALTDEAAPNGSWMGCAGLTNPTGQVIGMMPHPEAFLFAQNHPDWSTRNRHSLKVQHPDGFQLFQYMVAQLRRQTKHKPKVPIKAYEC